MKAKVKRIILLILTAAMLLAVCCSCAASGQSLTVNPENFNGKIIGVLTGSIFDSVAKENINDPIIRYFNSNADLAAALEGGKIDAYVNDEPVYRLLSVEYPNQLLLKQYSNEEYGFIFPKNSEKSELLCKQLNAFLAECKLDGTLEEIDAIWFGNDENRKVVDTEGLTAENGTLSFATTTDIGAPFAYLKDNHFIGYDVDVAVRFCRKYGYGLKIYNNTFSGMIANVSSGKCDFGAACITITDERKESVLFSDADYVGGSVLVCKRPDSEQLITSTEQLRGTKMAVQVGSIFDTVAEKLLPDCKLEYYNTATDLATALESGKVKSYIADEPVVRCMAEEYPSHRILTVLEETEYAFVMPKSNQNSQKLCEELNAFFRQCRENGTMDEVEDIWFGSDVSRQVIDRSGSTGENGKLTVAVCSAVGKPFCYIQNGNLVGYDVDLAVRFCAARGYDIELTDFDLSGMFLAIASGKCDFSCSGLLIGEERKETMLFSDPNYFGGSVVVVKDSDVSVESGGFFRGIAESFERTFLREKRYLLFLSGLGTTFEVVLLALVFGTLLGFLVYFGYYRRGKVFRKIVDAVMLIVENTPAVVILMIIYYVIFGNVDISGILVAVLGFIMVFAVSVIGLLKVAVGAVDIGQKEAALALGYTENAAFFRIILPQAAKHFLPGYKSAIVQLVKWTAVVGYIAVQDITKVSEIIRSRTYEPFFPLIATAIIYFAMTMLITAVINRIEINTEPTSRKKFPMLKGVNRQ